MFTISLIAVSVEAILGHSILSPFPLLILLPCPSLGNEGHQTSAAHIFESLYNVSGRWRDVNMISPALGRLTFSSTLGRAAPFPFPCSFAYCRGHRARGSQLPASALCGMIARTREGTKWEGVQKPYGHGRRILVADFGWVDGVGGGFRLFVVC